MALSALGWALGDPDRAGRLLALTGLTVDELRANVDSPVLQAAILRFLADHEPDLIACADALAVPPSRLVAAERVLTS